jgi:polyadenylate-binding protein
MNNNSLTPVPNNMPNFPPQMVGFPQGMQNGRPDINMPLPMPANPQGSPATQGVSLYVGNLDPEVNEQRLYEHFIHYGNIINTKVMRDSYNGESRGFGFVTFANINDALRAKSLLNYTKILDREIRIALKRNPSELNQGANLFFKNLDPSITSKKLEEECSKYGSIISCVVKVDEESGRPLGYGYVQFETPQNADDCVNSMNNVKLGEKNISVSFFLPKNKRQNPFAKSNLYIKQFPANWTKQEVERFVITTFGIYGHINSHGVFEDKNIQKKYGFVAFEEQECAQKALVELHDYEIEGSDEKLYVAYAQDKATRRRTLKNKHLKFKNETNLYIKSLKPEVDEGKIRRAFEKYGKVTSVCLKVHEPKNAPPQPNQQTVMPADKNSVRLRFGFINFMTPEEAKNAFTECKKDPAVIALIDHNLNTRSTEFIYYAQTKTVRQQYLRMQKKNLKTFKLIHDNVLQYYQLMKYFMPQNFRNNQRGGRGGNQGKPRGGFNNFNRSSNYKARGQGGHRDNNMNNMYGNTPAPNNNNTPMPHGNNQNTPAPNMMNFGNDFAMNMGGLQNMQNMQQALQQQMMGQVPGMMGNNQGSGMMPNMPAPMNNMMGNQSGAATTKDLAWLKENLATFETYDNHEKKNILGNLMYPLVESSVTNPDHVPKITGMLIDLEVLRASEIVEIMENQEALKERIDEAIGIINDTE